MKKAAKSILKDLKQGKDKKDRVMLYLDRDVRMQLKQFCSGEEIRMSDLVQRLIEKFLTEINER
ncbi:MAG: hypothetical protein HQK50_07160 [Oligoflexia bacterium]|nr:hypothetical protein [Oligoflexia bacterium]MBF0365332.1 hypothetical protein [Oligoflexia bacterium]